MEEVEEEFELVEEYEGEEVEEVVFLVVDCVGNCIRGLTASIHPHLPLHVHLLPPTTPAAYPTPQTPTAPRLTSEGHSRTPHLRLRCAILILAATRLSLQ